MPAPFRRRLSGVVAALAIAGLAAGTAGPATATTPGAGPSTTVSSATTKVSSTRFGVYTGPGAKAVRGARNFAKWSGLPVTQVLDFPPTGAWTGHNGLTGPTWLLDAHRGSGYRLEYSLPMLPDIRSTTLAKCARGDYRTYWRQTARNLLAAGHGNAIVRPGWEFNGGWYRWSAVGKSAAYIGCFRSVVTTMRAVKGTRFQFTWNVNLGAGPMKAETAWPGAKYVDYVGVDVYDLSWTWYPVPRGVSVATAQERAWAWIERGDHGLQFWKAFAVTHGRPLTFPEWGATFRTDKRGGGDNAQFVRHMFDFIADPTNRVAYATYFNIDAGSVRHDLTRTGTRFPKARAAFKSSAAALVKARARAAHR